MPRITTISIREETRDQLKQMKSGGERYEDVLLRLIEEHQQSRKGRDE